MSLYFEGDFRVKFEYIQRIKKDRRENKKTSRDLTKLKKLYQGRKQIYQEEINELHARIGLQIDPKERQKYFSQLKLLERKLTKAAERYAESFSRWQVSPKNKEQHEKSLITQKKDKEREIKSVYLERALYEIKTKEGSSY